MNLFQNLRKNQTGSAVAGFAFVVPLIVLLTVVILQFIFVVLNYAAISNLTENGARLLRIGFSETQVLTISQNKISESNLIPKNSRISIKNEFFNGINLKIIKVEIDQRLVGISSIRLRSQSYAF